VDPQVRAEAIKRLSYIEGHIAGVRRMVEEDKYCVDILRQTLAVRRAIERLESLILAGHLRNCVVEGIRAGDSDRITSELIEIFALNVGRGTGDEG